MGRRGPPSTITADIRKAFLSALRVGLPLSQCYAACGVSRSAVNRLAASDPVFNGELRSASAQGKVELLLRIHNAHDHWRAAAWLLERRWPQEFGRRRSDDVPREQFDEFVAVLRRVAEGMLPPDQLDVFRQRVVALLEGLRYRRWRPRNK